MLSKQLTAKIARPGADNGAAERIRELNAQIAERDAALATLEQTLAEQAEQLEVLRDALERSKYQTGILERSYATQLEEARGRADTAEASLAEQTERLSELEREQHRLANELEAARARLDMIGPTDAATIDDLLEQFSVPQPRTRERDRDERVEEPEEPGSLEEMLSADVMFAGKAR